MQRKFLMAAVIFVLVAASFAGGYLFGKFSEKSSISNLEASPVIQGFYATVMGKIVSISGREIKLEYGEEELEIIIAESVSITSLLGGASDRENAEFTDLKTGDFINAYVSVASGKKPEAISIGILPSPPEN